VHFDRAVGDLGDAPGELARRKLALARERQQPAPQAAGSDRPASTTTLSAIMPR
jgi:hypothetical protein